MHHIALATAICLIAAAVLVAEGCSHGPKTPKTTDKVCARCTGSGRLSGPCAICNGTGQRVSGVSNPLTCTSCGGTGSVSMLCPDCAGTGHVVKKN